MRRFFVAVRVFGLSAGLAALICVLVGGAEKTSLLSDAERGGYDLMTNAWGYPRPDPNIVLVDFDEDSVNAIIREPGGGYPVPRRVVAEVLEKVAAEKPELIGLDMLLSEARAPEDDQAMAKALEGAGNVVLASQIGSSEMDVVNPLPEFCTPDPASPSNCTQESKALGVGYANFPVDDDGFVRRAFLLPVEGYRVYPFAAALAIDFRQQGLQQVRPGLFRLDQAAIPLDDSELNTFLIGSWVPLSRRGPAYSAEQVRKSSLPPGLFKGKIVIIGESSAAGRDRHFTPVFRWRQSDGRRLMLSGAEVQAAVLATLLEGTALRILPSRAQWAVNFLLTWLALLLIVRERPLRGILAVVLLALVAYAGSQALFSWRHLWLHFVGSEMALALALPAGLGYRFVEERWLKSRAEAEREQLMNIFSRYVSPEAAAEIWSRRGEIVLAGQERTATVLFSDIRDFTALTAGKPSPEVLAWLNDYLTQMAEVIREHGGFLNKFIGDGIMVLYGVPISQGEAEDARQAVETALGMQQRVERMNREHAGDARYPRLKIGVGIHTGRVTAGNVGSQDRLEYSVIGETVNLASRLESLTKQFHTGIVLSPKTFELVKNDFAGRSLGETEVRGFEGRIPIYTVEASPGSARTSR